MALIGRSARRSIAWIMVCSMVTGEAWLAEGALKPVIGTRFALPDAVAALQHLEKRKVKGKVLLTLQPAS